MDPRKILGPLALGCFLVGGYQILDKEKPSEQRITVAALFSALCAVSGGMYLKSLGNQKKEESNEVYDPRWRNYNQNHDDSNSSMPSNITTNIDMSDRRQYHIYYSDKRRLEE